METVAAIRCVVAPVVDGRLLFMPGKVYALHDWCTCTLYKWVRICDEYGNVRVLDRMEGGEYRAMTGGGLFLLTLGG